MAAEYEIVERLKETVGRLANTPMETSLAEWDKDSNSILEAAATIVALAEALEPFGDLSKFCINGVDSISYPMDVADIQRARSALARLKGDSA
jgi:hypothetical protein